MNDARHSGSDAVAALQERAKELNCIYSVDEILARPGDTATSLAAVAAAIPPGWQYPEICSAYVRIDGTTYPANAGSAAEPCLREPIRLRGAAVGELCVYYSEARPERDEGPYLKEERRLLHTLAERVADFLLKQQTAAPAGESAVPTGSEWRLIVQFLEKMDARLLERITRKMLTHLRWRGVASAEVLAAELDGAARAPDENRPIATRALPEAPLSAAQVFRIAADALDDEEIVRCIQSWISQEKIAFLSHALEDQGSSLGDIIGALERFQALAIDEDELPHSTRATLRVGLLRRFFTDDIDFINTAKEVVRVDNFHALTRTLLYPQGSHGKLGGKSAGLFLAERIVSASVQKQGVLQGLRVPRTWYIASDALLAFLRHNNLEGIYDQKYTDIRQVRQQYPHVVQVFRQALFPPELEKGLATALDDLGAGPLIVRSSSLLEDRTGASFSGKYKSLFLANVGSRQERLAALEDAVAEVYASIFGPDPIEYRAEKNLLDLHEEMGIMIQEVVGRRAGRYFLPAFAGVAFSSNEFRWSPRIQREDGLVRLVLGLGTRAVDRVSDDFPVLLAPGQPGLRAASTPDEIVRYSPRLVDLIDLDRNSFATVTVRELLRECGNDLPLIRRVISILEHDRLRRPAGLRVDFEVEDAVVTFEGLTSDTPFMVEMTTLLHLLRNRLHTEIDLEFASDGANLYLLQCRPQSQQASIAAPTIPHVADSQVLFSAHRYVSNARVNDIQYLVYVDPAKYAALPDSASMRQVGRVVGRLNRVLPRRRFVLIGPGRWGSRGDIRLGVSVTYSDINNTAALIEVARQKGNYVPELSFGTHFFQDLVEAEIRYLPLFPDEPGNRFDEGFLLGAHNCLPEMVPEFAPFGTIVRVIDVGMELGGATLQILMNGQHNEALGYFEKTLAARRAAP